MSDESEQKLTKGTKSLRMHPLYVKADALSGQVIGAAMEVHRDKGPGLTRIDLRTLLDARVVRCAGMQP